MKRFTFEKQNGEILRLIMDEGQLEIPEFKDALAYWKSQWKLISTGEYTKIKQEPNSQLVFSDDILLWKEEKWNIVKKDIWVATLNDKEIPLLAMIQESFILEP